MASQCEGVQCPAQRLSDCELLTPPGGCCPICGAELRILFSKKQADRVSKAGRLAPVTVRNITTILSQHISVPQCEVFGYVSIESDLVILVLPVTLQPTPLQVSYRESLLFSLENPLIFLWNFSIWKFWRFPQKIQGFFLGNPGIFHWKFL